METSLALLLNTFITVPSSSLLSMGKQPYFPTESVLTLNSK